MPRDLKEQLLRKKLKKTLEKKKEIITSEADKHETETNEEINVAHKFLSPTCNGTTDQTFESIQSLMSSKTYKAVEALGYTHMTEVQAKVIPMLLGDDLYSIKATAKTGSGKTLAYLVPVVELMHKLQFKPRNGTGAIIVCPTRELAMQTYGVLRELVKFHSQTTGLVMGGVVRKAEADKLYWGVNILVATPGRLVDHFENTKGFLFNKVCCLVIDEADRIFDIGFENDIKKILKHISGVPHQTLLFSATQDKRVDGLAQLAFHSPPLEVDLGASSEKATVQQLKQDFLMCPTEKRFLLLFCLLRRYRNKKVMVFFNSRSAIKFHHDLLNFIDIPAMYIHGEQEQEKRMKTFYHFNNMDNGTLLCTDIATRGWDIPAVDKIIQYDPPDDPREYIHRVGRTARGGREGHAIIFLREEEWEFVHFLRAHKVQLGEKEVNWAAMEADYEEYSKLEKLVDRNGYLRNLAKTALRGYVRSYLSHQVKNIFNPNTLDLRKVAECFLLKTAPFETVQDAIKPPPFKKKAHQQNQRTFKKRKQAG